MNNEKFKYIFPTIEYKEQAIEYINEFIKYNSDINGTGNLDSYLEDYEQWLKKINEDKTKPFTDTSVPSLTYFLIRINDNKIIGMINIRLMLNEKLKKHGGNIGYSIRPTNRNKGYNLINLYLGLLVCKQYNLKEVLLDCEKNNLGSSKTMKHLGAKKITEKNIHNIIVEDYIINVNESVDKYSEEFKNYFA